MERVVSIDMIIEKDSFEMIKLMLKNNGKIAVSLDENIFVFQGVIGLDLDSGGTVDETLVVLDDGETAFARSQAGFLYRIGDDAGVDKGIFALFISILVLDDDGCHLFGHADLNGADSDCRAQILLFGNFRDRRIVDILQHLHKDISVFFAQGQRNIRRFPSDEFVVILDYSVVVNKHSIIIIPHLL